MSGISSIFYNSYSSLISISVINVFHPFTLNLLVPLTSKMCFVETTKLDTVLSGLKETQNKWLTVRPLIHQSKWWPPLVPKPLWFLASFPLASHSHITLPFRLWPPSYLLVLCPLGLLLLVFLALFLLSSLSSHGPVHCVHN